MEFYRDALRRALRDADAAQRHAMPGWRSALRQLFDRPDEVDPRVTASLVGSPSRRNLLRLGGVAVIGTAFVACGGSGEDEEGHRAAETGETIVPPDPSTTTTLAPAPPSSLNDFQRNQNAKTNLSILRSAASIEYLAVDVYEQVARDLTTFGLDPATDRALVTLFAEHHQAHADSLNALAERVSYTDEEGDDVEGTAWEEPNPYLAEDVLAPLLPTLITRQATLSFARDLENLAAGTYTEVTGLLTEIRFRKEMMNIGSVEARHAAALSIALGEDGAPSVFVDTKNRMPDTALVAATDEEEEAKAEGGEAAAG
jgi:rubrerythrin